MKTEDDATELRLKAALDAVEAREASSRETGNRLVRRLEDSKRIRDKAAERDAGIAAAQQTVDATRAQPRRVMVCQYAQSLGKSRQLYGAPASLMQIPTRQMPCKSRRRCPAHHRRP
ncbi:MAG: hypothetical protein ACLRM9_07635 [Collinsella aerofaciens]